MARLVTKDSFLQLYRDARTVMFSHSRRNKPSLFIITTQKCGTTLLNKIVFSQIHHLKRTDYESLIYRGIRVSPTFSNFGHLYGPIRINLDPDNPVFQKLIYPITKNDFINDKKVLFVVRDPRDIVVSRYYSLGWTHGMSPNKEIAKIQEEMRNTIQSQSIDEYVLCGMIDVEKRLKLIKELAIRCNYSVVLRYEDMINDFEAFSGQLKKLIPLSETMEESLYKESRPNKE